MSDNNDDTNNEDTPATEAAQNERAGADVVDFAEVAAGARNKRQPQGDDVDRLIERFNRKYAVVNDGGDLRVFWERADQLRPGRYVLDRFRFADFHRMHQNRRLTRQVPDPKNPGKPKDLTQSIAAWWLNDPRRREHLGGVIFDPTRQATPDHWNLWRGFGVPPRRGSWRLLRQHCFEVICSRERRDFDYLLNTMARMFRHPELPAEVATVLKGDEGCAKGILGRALYKIMGQHGLHISHPEHLRGKHNAHLRDCVYLFADEAFYAGDKAHESILKAIITEDTLAVEPKNKDLIDVPNYLHVWLASNLDWVVPASLRARRWFIPKVSDHRIGDREYFAAIYREIDNGGLEGMLFELLNRDIGNFDPRAVPLTEPLAIQKLHSLDTLHRWWMTCLERQFIWCSRFGVRMFREWFEFCTTELLMRSYLQWCDETKLYQRQTRIDLGAFMAKMYQDARPKVAHPVHEITALPTDRGGGSSPVPDPTQPEIIGFGLPGATLTEDLDALERLAVVRKRDQHGYRLGDLEDARARFQEAVGDLPMPWRR
jgi:hypothetical protein